MLKKIIPLLCLFPALALAQSVAVSGPAALGAGDIPQWNDKTGALLKDSGAPLLANSVTQQLVINPAPVASPLANGATGFGVGVFGAGIPKGDINIDEVAFGRYTLNSDVSGRENTAIGDHALSQCIDCNNNTIVGSAAASGGFVHGYFNTAIGVSALGSAATVPGTAVANTAIGNSALMNITNGQLNTAAGSNSLVNLTTGLHNVGVGDGAAFWCTTCAKNVMIGSQVASYRDKGLISGADNVFVGADIDASLDPTNSIALGANILITASNQMILGNSATIATTLYGSGVTLPNSAYHSCTALTTNASGLIGCTASDPRVKDDKGVITPEQGLATVMAIPDEHRFEFKNGYGPAGVHYGFMADDMRRVLPELVHRGAATDLTPDGELQFDKTELGPFAIAAIKAQQAEIRRLWMALGGTILLFGIAVGNLYVRKAGHR